MLNYISSQSFRCLLGKQSKDVIIKDNLFLWKVGKKQHMVISGSLTNNNINDLKNYLQNSPCNFHYISQENLHILKQHFTVDKSNHESVILDITDLSFKGNSHANKSVRHALNRCSKEHFTLQTNFRDILDIEKLRNEWSDLYTAKLFRDNSSKNQYFYTQGFHLGLISLFIYKDNDLVSFGTLSQPDDRGYCSYVVGKALFKRHYGLSEYADVELYKLGQTAGVKVVNMGAADNDGLMNYKSKFPHSIEKHFDGKINV
jgi:hypothetical protein